MGTLFLLHDIYLSVEKTMGERWNLYKNAQEIIRYFSPVMTYSYHSIIKC